MVASNRNGQDDLRSADTQSAAPGWATRPGHAALALTRLPRCSISEGPFTGAPGLSFGGVRSSLV